MLPLMVVTPKPSLRRPSEPAIMSSFQNEFSESYEVLLPKGPATVHQEALIIFWISLTVLWLYLYLYQKLRWLSWSPTKSPIAKEDVNSDSKPTDITIVVKDGNDLPKSPNRRAPIDLSKALFAAFTVGWIMVYFFICDYLHYFPKSNRTYSRDLFLFLVLMLFLVAASFTCRESETEDKLLGRQQTEEWKGWMQVMFVWYHYFKAAETYNAVRVYIGAYVWMTGFGNFSFFWVKRDYSLRRMLKMLFRLNFLVVIVTMVTNNQYMLYYICAMHTFWFLSVYAMMRPFEHYNDHRKVMYLKFLLYFLVVFFVFDIQEVGPAFFAPFTPILNYKNSLHEWLFRSRLDHYSTFVGMLCAYYHPNFEKALHYIKGKRFERIIVVLVVTFLLSVNYIWYSKVFILPKYDYNKLHSYTSWIPIVSYIILRNINPWLRRHHMNLFAYLGKMSLETYIAQLHVYLQLDAKALLVYIPDYPLLNFSLNSFIYLVISQLLFNATETLNEYLFPSDTKKTVRNAVVVISWISFCYMATLVLRNIS